MCALKSNREDPSEIINKWVEDIKDFKDNCKRPILASKNDDVYESVEVKELVAKIRRRKVEEAFMNNINDKNDSKGDSDVEKRLKLARIIAMKALDKEYKYEKRMEKEEMMKEENDKKIAKEELEKEKKKRDELKKAILISDQTKKAKELQKKLQLQRELADIKNDVQMKITRNRNLLKQRIHRMKKVSERDLMKTRQQINDVRLDLTDNVMKAEKKGNMKMCKANTSEGYRNKYCDKFYKHDFYENRDCKKQKEFCYICCENEFGDMHPDDRELCYSQCEAGVLRSENAVKVA